MGKKKKKNYSRKRKTVVNVGKLLVAGLAASQALPATTEHALDPAKWKRLGAAFQIDIKALPSNPGRIIKATVPFIGYGFYKGMVSWRDREIISTKGTRITT